MARFEFKDREPVIIKKQSINVFNRYFYPVVSILNFILLLVLVYRIFNV